MSPPFIRDSRVLLKAMPSSQSRRAQLQGRLLPASHDHPGDYHTYSPIKDLKPLKAVAGTEVI